MEQKKGNIYLKIFVNILIYIGVILFLFFLLPELIGFFLPFILAWLIAWIANPLVNFLENRVKIVRKHSSVLIILLVIGLVALLLYGIGRFLFVQAGLLIDELPNILSPVSSTLEQVNANLSAVLDDLPLAIQDPISQINESIANSFNSFLADAQVPQATIGITRNLGDYFLFIITMFITAYFFIKDRDKIIKQVKDFTPNSIIEQYELIKNQFNHAVLGYIKAQFQIMLVVVVILYIGFKITGMRYSFLMAMLTGFIDLLPIFGTGFVLWPLAVVELILGNYVDALIFFGLYVLCQIVKNILQPKLVGDSVGLNPLTTLIFMYIGFQFAGLFGLILAIPTGLILMTLYRVGMFDNIIRGFKILILDLNAYRKF